MATTEGPLTKDECVPNRIVCAAIRNKHGDIICGVRHWDQIMRAQAHGKSVWNPSAHHIEQGFVDRYGQFYSRLDAWAIAEKAGQILPGSPNKGRLYSEDLY